MSKGGLPGQLPEHMLVGRGSGPGPVTGAYAPFTFHVDAVAASQTDTEYVAFPAPFDMRIEEISVRALSSAGTSPILEVSSNSVAAIDASETALLSATLDMATLTHVARAAGTTATLVEAARNISQGTFIILHATTGVGETCADVDFSVTVFPYGHVNADPAND